MSPTGSPILHSQGPKLDIGDKIAEREKRKMEREERLTRIENEEEE
ncbi:hypothetical protein K3495_g5565 [Podosphaera aphanis]|nr:hypothetical protein K3495_g5565 [Podosphaera aphanis]